MSSRRDPYSNPINVITTNVFTQNLQCCYDTSKIQSNVAIYVSSQTGDDTINNGRTATSPVATLSKAAEILNRIQAWENEATIYLMDTVVVSGSTNELTGGIYFRKPKIGKAQSVRIAGYQPTTTSFLITGISGYITPTNLTNYPIWVNYTVSSVMTAGVHARKRFIITHPTTGLVVDTGVVYTNTTTGFQMVNTPVANYTGYTLTIYEPGTGLQYPCLSLTGTSTSDMYFIDGDLPIIVSEVDVINDYAFFTSHVGGAEITFKTVRWQVGSHAADAFVGSLTLTGSYVFAETSGSSHAIKANSIGQRLHFRGSWLHDVAIYMRPDAVTDNPTPECEVLMCLFDGNSASSFDGTGYVYQTAFLNGSTTESVQQGPGTFVFKQCGLSGMGVAPSAFTGYSGARSIMLLNEFTDTLGGTSPIIHIINSDIRFDGATFITTAQTLGAASNYLIVLEQGSYCEVSGTAVTGIMSFVDAGVGVAAIAELSIDSGSSASMFSSIANFGAGPTQIDWIDGGGPAAFPVAAIWQQNGSCRVAAY